MKSRKFNFDDYLRKKLEDPTFRDLFLQQREALRLGIEIARLRKEAGMSQRELGERVGMRKQNVARIERPDYRGFTLATLQRIALALGHHLVVRFVSAKQPRIRSSMKSSPRGISFSNR